MKAEVYDREVWSSTKDTVVFLDFEGGQRAVSFLSEKSKEVSDQLAHAVSAGDFKAKDGQQILFYTKGKLPCARVIIAGLGKQEDFRLNKVRCAVAGIVNAVRASGIKEMAFVVNQSLSVADQAAYCSAITESSMLSHFRFDVHKSERDSALLEKIILCVQRGVAECQSAVKYASVVSRQCVLARTLVSMSASEKPPKVVAEMAQRQAGRNVAIKTFFKKDLERMGAGGILAVNKGSHHEPCLLVLEYNAKNNAQKKSFPCVCLVGKGIVFDSGGLDLKNASNMETMKGDLGGAAAVMHALFAAAELGLPIRIVAIAALTENLVGPQAYKPGDIVKTLSGKTVEVLNTDAEGRMVLADALQYAKSCNPEFLIDIATLTGACWIALGTDAAGLFSNNNDLRDRLVAAGEATYERVWPMPMFEEYAEYMKSDFADLKNVVSNAPSGAGAITAAKFLESFVDKKQKWAHLDIAAHEWMEQEKDYRPRGGTGFGVRLLTRFLADLSQKPE